MDKSAIKSFAVESRRKMVENVKYQASLIGITANEIKEPISKAKGMETYNFGSGTYSIYDKDIERRKSLVKEIKNKGFDNVIEEVAYTWFNRIIAIRFMEVNDYLPTRTRVLSSETEGKIEPDIVTDALDLDMDLGYSPEDKDLIIKLMDENKLDDLFQFLFIKQCNKLNDILPGLFEETDDYLELLLNISFTSEDSVVRQLIDSIPEEDFTNQVEIIGWLYQYYISEKKDQVINLNKKKNIKKEDIPAATQLFTTDWVVKYMVDNSLGRYWIERNPNSSLKNCLEYYLDEAKQDNEIQNKLEKIRSENVNIEELTLFDPCMGSGHILVYAFEVFFEIYKELGYLERDIPELILKNNIFGLDIDDRAYQLAYFAVLMKARKYDRNILKKRIVPNVFSIQESGNITNDVIEFIRKHDENIVNDVIYLKEIFKSGKEFGSLIQVKNINWIELRQSLNSILSKSKSTLVNVGITDIINNELLALVNQAELLSKKYFAVVTNPPYMNKFEKNLKEFTRKYYKDYSRDLFSMFIYRNFDFCKKYGYNALMTPFVWMFIKNFENLRNYIINNKSISSLIQLEYSAFSEATVPICTFVLSNFDDNYEGTYLKLSEFTGGMDVQKEIVLKIISGDETLNNNNKFITNQTNFNKIPGSPIAYWAENDLINAFEKGINLKQIGDTRQGMATSDNKRFLRLWHEVSYDKIGFDCKNAEEAVSIKKKWYPYNKGGSFCKWWGNQDYLINYENNGYELIEYATKLYKSPTRSIRSISEYFKICISWSKISSGKSAFRYYPNGFLFDAAGCSIFFDNDKYINYILCLLNSNVTNALLSLISPTINYEVGHIASLPVIFNDKYLDEINQLAIRNINICKNDWDDYETSWNFVKHPLLKFNGNLEENYLSWVNFKKQQFELLKQNEITLNNIFSVIYNVKIDCNVEDKFISMKDITYENTIKSFISYVVGCMFGRYSLDNEGLIFAGGDFNLKNYHKFIPDDDNIIPILDTEYFEDDIVGKFIEFIKICFGDNSLEENLDFIANALNKKGKTNREILRNYFLNDFFKDHAKTYKKCPIFWQFDSGKQNAFKCLIYMHRYDSGIVARVRTDYLHKTQKAIEESLDHCESIISRSTNKSELKQARKDKDKFIKQLNEIKDYDEVLAHIAHQQIEIDLDDGVKNNYAKFQNVEIAISGQKTKKVNLLKKI